MALFSLPTTDISINNFVRMTMRIILFFLVCIVLPSIVVADFEKVGDVHEIDTSRLSMYSSHYKLDESGNILEGVTRSNDGPIDYSPLLNDATLHRFFVNSVLGCDEKVFYCSEYTYVWPRSGFMIAIRQEGNLISRKNVHLLVGAIIDSLFFTDLPIEFTKEPEKENIQIHVGSIEYLLQRASANGHTKAAKFLEQKLTDKEKRWISRIFGNYQKNNPLCYTSNKDRDHRGHVSIYLTLSGVTSCLHEALAQSIDLYETDLSVPSIASSTYKFKSMTHFDEFVFRVLSEGRVGRNLTEAEERWHLFSDQVRAQLDTETIDSLNSDYGE